MEELNGKHHFDYFAYNGVASSAIIFFQELFVKVTEQCVCVLLLCKTTICLS